MTAPPGGFTVANVHIVASGALIGTCDVTMPDGMVLHRVSIFRKQDGKTWAAPPSKQMIDRSGTVLRDTSGKIRWEPVVSFHNRIASDAWGAAVMEAIRGTELDATP